MKKNFIAANIDRFHSGYDRDSRQHERNKVESDIDEGKLGKEELPPKRGTLPRINVAKTTSMVHDEQSIISTKPLFNDISIIVDRQIYDDFCIRLKERGMTIRSGLRTVIAEIVENPEGHDKETIEKTIRSAGTDKKDRLYKTTVRVPHELYLDAFRFIKRKHITMLMLVNAAIAIIMTK